MKKGEERRREGKRGKGLRERGEAKGGGRGLRGRGGVDRNRRVWG